MDPFVPSHLLGKISHPKGFMCRPIRGIAALAFTVAVLCVAKDRAVENKVDIAALWIDPVDSASRDLFYGPGGPEHAPRLMEFQFVEEDTSGTNPKYIVTDADGVKWKMKLDEEARPETAASRLMWAAGYHAHEEYFLASAYLRNLPSRLRRGQKLIGPMGDVHGVRLRRLDSGTKVDIWKWRESPFDGTREFNGLRVLMAVLNNWDLKDSNNAILEKPDGRRVYMVSDLGASFGSGTGAGLTSSSARGKGHLAAYKGSTFIKSNATEGVDFGAPKGPAAVDALAFPIFMRRMQRRWIAKDVPPEHGRWVGEILGRLSPVQLRDIFRASGFSSEECEGFAQVLEGRIAARKAL
jgi:hypothetical protein